MDEDVRQGRAEPMYIPRRGTVGDGTTGLSSAAATSPTSTTLLPTLADILADRAPQPYTLAAFTAFLSQNHCLETLEFVIDAQRYAMAYEASRGEVDEYMLAGMWARLMQTYVHPGAIRQVNLPHSLMELLLLEEDHHPPSPLILRDAVRHVHDLLSDSTYGPFLSSMQQQHRSSSSSPPTNRHQLSSSSSPPNSRSSFLKQYVPARMKSNAVNTTTTTTTTTSQTQQPRPRSLVISSLGSSSAASSNRLSIVTSNSDDGGVLLSDDTPLSPPDTPPLTTLTASTTATSCDAAVLPQQHTTTSSYLTSPNIFKEYNSVWGKRMRDKLGWKKG